MANTPMTPAQAGAIGGATRWARVSPEERTEYMRRLGAMPKKRVPVAEQLSALEERFEARLAALSAEVERLRDQVAA